MAEQQQPIVTTQTFTGGMVKDMLDMFTNMKRDTWTHARNATTCLPNGMRGGLSTEPANTLCTTFPFTMIGAIPLSGDEWMVFLTNDTVSEIGTFKESQCTYTTLTGPQTCLGLRRSNLISGAARRGFDCGYIAYWTDGRLNPNRTMNTAKVPFVQSCTTVGDCITCTDTTVLDCEKLRLAPHVLIPCMKLAKGNSGGTLRNGSYQIALRYTINETPCTDFVALSSLESVFNHNNEASALNLSISGAEKTIFTEMELVLVSMINFQTEARSLGIFNTTQETVYIDDVDLTLPIIPLELLPLNTPALEHSDAIYSVGDKLVMVGPQTKPEFNYQPLANNIRTWWTCVEYDENYYYNGGDQVGMNVGMYRDEVYAAYIRWVYNTGDKTSSYHIPGLPAGTSPTVFLGSGGLSTGDSGVVVAYGRMAGYSSTRRYDNRRPDIWGPLCGKPIMHHRFPDQATSPVLTHFTNNRTIRVMGWYFDNIALPVDNNGNVIPDIVGYEILRANRDGHKSVIAKGMFNHMREYRKDNGGTGLFQNYPYNDLHPDRYLTTSQTIGTVGGTVDGFQGNELTGVSDRICSFHSPDTSFRRPNLGGSGSVVLYQSLAGYAEGNFDTPYLHPKFKLATDLASFFAINIGVLVSQMNLLNSLTGTAMSFTGDQDVPMTNPLGFGTIPEGPLGSLATVVYAAAVGITATINTLMTPITIRVVSQQVMSIINGLLPTIQYARQYDSHGWYNEPVYSPKSIYSVRDYQYVDGQLQTFGGFDINNLYRNNYVAFDIDGALPTSYPFHANDPVGGGYQNYGSAVEFYNTDTGGHTGNIVPGSVDCSRFTLGQGPSSPYPPGARSVLGMFRSPIISWYGAYKIPQLSQYGDVDDPKQLPISCVIGVNTQSAAVYTSPVLFGGDCYINRYTEKNPMMFFNDWVYGQPPDYQYDYTQYENIPYPRYWINNSKVYYDFWQIASQNWHLDELASTASNPWPPLPGINSKFYVESGYFYLFCNGVRDFYVESDINVGYRDWEDDHSKRFYDPYGYTNLDYMFRTDLIKSDILYKYDYSLSASQFWNTYFSWGKCLPRSYDPTLAYTCYSYYPRRLQYSLSQKEEQQQDNWRMFLPNNYLNTPSVVTAIKEVNETGALILMKDAPPGLLLGTQSIPSTNGTDYTVGSGDLFQQDLTQISNADRSYQYGSCQNRLSVINTPNGLFWVSQSTGKIFNYNGQLNDITPGISYHMSLYLPSQLLQQYPEYALSDNPLMGVGVQCIYDNINQILYICKKDYKAIYPELTTLVNNDQFAYDTGYESLIIQLTDPLYFENASWTLSYDCKEKEWIGFHDWFPALNIPSKTHFLTTNSVVNSGMSVWRHNKVSDLFCNYYNIDYPFEIEYSASTGVNMTTIESIEYFLDSFNYKADQIDKFLMYQNTFDRAVISNAEQSTGPLILVPKPWNDPYAITNYPDFTSAIGIGILQSKVENIYRFNFIRDFTNDRGQFTLPMVQYWVTAANGYVKSPNPLYLDYLKPKMQLKKLRYRNNSVFLRRNIVGYNSLTFYFSQSKHQRSYR